MRQYYPLMATGDEQEPDRPSYNVYRSGKGRGGRRGGSRPKSAQRGAEGGKPARPPRGDGEPEYRVYRSSRNPLGRLRGGGDGTSLREKPGRGGSRGGGGRRVRPERAPGETPTWRKVLRYALIFAAFWFLLSAVLFAISAQMQKGKLDEETKELLGGNPFLAAFPQNILVIGTDARPEAKGNPEAETRPQCIEQGATGQAPSDGCAGFRADTLMIVRAGGGAFEKLSIPRDTLADIPGVGPEKINSAYARGGAALQVETVENFLGININHVVLLDFQGFAEFIDAIGGVDVNVSTPVKSKVDGGSSQGGVTLKLNRGKAHLDGAQALAYARTRTNLRCTGGEGDRKACKGGEDDLDRARRQQEVLTAIKSRLTSITRIPINFIRGPLIAWNAPKAMVSDMGAFTLPQLAIALAIGGKQGTQVLGKRNATLSPAGNIVIPQTECERALRKFLGKAPDEPPPCSPAPF